MTSITTAKPSVTITYCPGCKWALRAGWMAQELLATFEADLCGITIQPGSEPGVFRVSLADDPKTVLWDRAKEGGFPEIKILKRRLRDMIDPNRDLGHIDAKQ